MDIALTHLEPLPAEAQTHSELLTEEHPDLEIVPAVEKQLRGQNMKSLNEAGHPLMVWHLDPHVIQVPQNYCRAMPDGKEPDFQALVQSIKVTGGNIQPILIREIARENKGDLYRFELIVGLRRLIACQHTDTHVQAVVLDDESELTQLGGFVADNIRRRPVSPIVLGRLGEQLKGDLGLLTDAQVAQQLGRKPSDMCNAFQLAKLDAVILCAFVHEDDLQFKWAPALTRSWRSDARAMTARAKVLTASKDVEQLSAKEVYKRLIGDKSISSTNSCDITVRGEVVGCAVSKKDAQIRVRVTAAMDEQTLDRFAMRLGQLIESCVKPLKK